MQFDKSKTEPYFTNEQGVKWWPMSDGIWLTQLPDGEKNYVAIHGDEIVAEGKALDAVGMKLDLIRFAEKETS